MRFSYLAAGAVELFIKVAGLVLLASQRGDDKARIGFAAGPFRLGDDPPFAAPALARLPDEVTEAPRRFASALALLLRRGEFGLDLSDEPTVLGQAKQEIDAVGLAPRHQRLASKTQSARNRMRTLGQCWRIWATIRAVSSTLPHSHRCGRRNLAANRAGHRTRKAADSSSSRNSHGRNALPLPVQRSSVASRSKVICGGAEEWRR